MSHDNFQPPGPPEPEKDDDDRMYGALSDLAGIDTYDTNLRDHPKAYEILDRLMTHAYGEGRTDERESLAEPLPAAAVFQIKKQADEAGLDVVGFAWLVQKAALRWRHDALSAKKLTDDAIRAAAAIGSQQ